MHTLFISDLHLDPTTPETTAIFLRLLHDQAQQADAIYILGDFFETWIGDDATTPFMQTIISALRTVTQSGTPIYFMHGNRDFLIGNKFTQQSGCQLLPDPTIIDLYGTPTLIMHGDTLCTDDEAYLRFRQYARNPCYQRIFLSLPLIMRRFIANFLRKRSQRHIDMSSAIIMDANATEIQRITQQYATPLLIHGHTHRPSIQLSYGNTQLCRIVLSDWHKQGNMLICRADGIRRLLPLLS